MPELPEVEFGRRLAERTLVDRRLREVRCADDDIVFVDRSAAEVESALIDARVDAVARRGKYLWLELDRRPWPLVHFGMTGAFRVPHEQPLRLEASPKEPSQEWPPRFWKLWLTADDGSELAFTNSRRLGRVRFVNDPRSEPPVSKLGFDPLLDPPDLGRFGEMVGRRRGTLKGLLLDQGFAAGVGNWIADELLFQAGLDPRRRGVDLDDDEIRRLHGAMESVIATAVDVDADKSRFPRDWLFHARWGRDETATTADGERVEHLRIGGRTTAWVPSRQS